MALWANLPLFCLYFCLFPCYYCKCCFFCVGDEPKAVVQACLQTTAYGDRSSLSKLACEMIAA